MMETLNKTRLKTSFISELLSSMFTSVSPILLVVLIVFLVVALLIGVIFLFIKGLFTAVVIGGVLFVIVGFLFYTKALPTEKYPLLAFTLAFMPIIGFFLGWILEVSGAFMLLPLAAKPEAFAPFEATSPTTAILNNIEPLLVMLLLIILVITIGSESD
ncbi:MAG: hypothetical protein DRJ03_29160 [Chloroflexi bacterium]|nr:MAG: hypothetical protein DRJ03_29160 [Chloroflexota bacterium]